MAKRDLIVGLDNNKAILRQFVSSMKDEEIRRRIKDYWTIYEHLDHLVVCQKMLLGRIEQFIAEESPVMRPYVPEDKPEVADEKRGTIELVEAFCELRDRQIALIRRADKRVWQKEGAHEEYSRYSFEILVRHTLLHDSFHMLRMEELWIEKEQYIKALK
jgi:hypothetical protein